ncbi:MAG TPA: hypothetical protein VH640_19505 [Bryobacteraceae bacterium]
MSAPAIGVSGLNVSLAKWRQLRDTLDELPVNGGEANGAGAGAAGEAVGDGGAEPFAGSCANPHIPIHKPAHTTTPVRFIVPW